MNDMDELEIDSHCSIDWINKASTTTIARNQKKKNPFEIFARFGCGWCAFVCIFWPELIGENLVLTEKQREFFQ